MEVLLLDASFQPLSVITRQRMLILLSKERISFVSPTEEQAMIEALQVRRFPDGPVIVRLVRSVRIPRRLVRPSRASLLLRDNAECQYCGTAVSGRDATIDHVVPASKGGRRTWENLCIACARCNHRKANKTPAQAGMKLRRAPVALHAEFVSLLLLRYPQLKEAYESLFVV
jgi:hypothetical protein